MSTTTYPKIFPTADPRVRLACYGARNWRTEVQDSVDEEVWYITGPAYESKVAALACVDSTVSSRFGEPTHDRIRSLMAQVEQLTAEKAELQAKVYEEKSHNGALMVDADRREQRALALLPDCDAHKRELQYLRHCASWYWHCMNDSDEARAAVVTALMLTAMNAREAGPDATVKAADIAEWLEKAVKKQNEPLRRTSYPTLADCLRSAHGDCEHDSVCGDVIAEVAEALGLTLADPPAKCKPVKAKR